MNPSLPHSLLVSVRRGQDRGERRQCAMRRPCFLGSPLLRAQAAARQRVVDADSRRL